MPSSVGVVVLLLLAFGPAVVSAPIGAPGHGDSNLHPDVSPFVDAQSGTTNVSLAAVAGDTFGSPPAPTDLVATPYNTTQIDLTWTNPIVVPFAYTTVALGDSPSAYSMAYDSRTGQVFVSEGTYNVAVISDSTNTVVLTIGGFNDPSGLAYDSALGEVYVVNSGADTVSVVSDVTDTITATINVGNSPSGITYDSGLGEMFVANGLTNKVSVIDDATNTIVTSVDVGYYPTATVYDPLTSEVYVSNVGDNTVSVIADATNTVIATTTVGSSPNGVAYDAGTSQVFVANWEDDTVSILSDATHLVVGSVGSVGPYPNQVAYDAALNEVFVGDEGASTVSVLSDITDTLVATIPVGDEPYGMVYDSGAQHVFVANSLSNNVSVLAQFPLVDNHVYVYSGPSCTGTPAAVDLGLVGTAYPDAGLSGGTAYSYTVTASNSAGESANSSCANATTFGSPPPPPAPPAAPTGLVVTPVSPTQIDLVWDNPVGPLTDNHAYEYAGWACSGSATAYDFMAVVSSSNFPGLTPSTVYSYTVTASNSTGESAPSACLATTTFGLGLPPPAPTHLAASTVGPYQINLSWANPPAVPSVITSVGVGASPDWAAYDAGTHEVFVPNANGNSVSVISDATDTIAATISLGAGASPSGIAYDPAKGELFVATLQGLKVISDGTDVVVGTIGLGLDPYGVVYDSGTGKIFVANARDDNVSVISDVTDTVVTSVTVGAFPFGVEYDPGMHQIFVVNEGDGTVSVISDATDTVVATVPVGASPYDAAYDAATGQVFVTNYADGTVSVISDSTDTIVATVTGVDTPYVIVYNAYLGEIFIGDQGTNTISVINDTTDSVVATVGVGTSPYGIAYDAGTYQVFVANSVSDNVSVMALLPQTDNHVYVYSGPSCTGTPAAVDLGLVGTAYPDAGLSGGTAYSYTVTASNSAGEGPTSGCAANTTFEVAPSLTVSNVSFYTFNETWSSGTGRT